MPYIPQSVIQGVFYLYANAEDAKAGRNPGGTGFVVLYDGFSAGGVYDGGSGGHHFYGVTNWHVALTGGYSVIRLNLQDGGVDIIALEPHEWFFIPGRYDVAVVPLNIDRKTHEVSFTSTRQFCNPPDPRNGYKIGIGDDTFMIGLFVDHAGLEKNVPSARFGNISMLPDAAATIDQTTGYAGECFVVDMHSRTGFSGSPVYVYRTPGGDLTDDFFGEEVEIRDYSGLTSSRPRAKIVFRHLFKLLGILSQQFPERWQIKQGSRLKRQSHSPGELVGDERYVEGMSGMTVVIPAWAILEVILMPKLAALRRPGIVAGQGSM